MITGTEFDKIIYGYWADRFNCEREHFLTPGTIIIEEENLEETGKIHIYQIKQKSIMRVGPELKKQLKSYGEIISTTSLTGHDLLSLLGEKYRINLYSVLIDHFLDGKNFIPYSVEPKFQARQVNSEIENSILLAFYDACTESDLDEAEIYKNDPDPVIFGLFEDEKMIAYASHRYWDDIIADIGVLVHPDYRSIGLGKAVVSLLITWCLENNVIPMYRVFETNKHSLRIPISLGFNEKVKINSFTRDYQN